MIDSLHPPARLTVLLAAAALAVAAPGGCTKKSASSNAPQAAGDQSGAAPVAAPDPAASPSVTAPPPADDTHSTGEAPYSWIAFPERSHDFGTIWDIDTVSHSFPFTNTGTDTLLVKDMTTTCGCTVASLSAYRFEPGQGDAVTITYKPKKEGRQTKDVVVVTNSPQEYVRLVITADVRKFITMSEPLVKLGVRKLDRDHHMPLTLTSPCFDVKVQSIESDSEYLSATVTDQSPPEPDPATGARYRGILEVTLSREAPWGTFSGSLDVTFSGRLSADEPPVEHTYNVLVIGNLYRDLLAEPSLFGVSALPPNEPFERSISLTRPDGGPFTVKSVRVLESNLPGVSVRAGRFEYPGRSGYRLYLTGNTGTFRGRIKGTIEVITDVPGDERLVLDFLGHLDGPETN